MIRLKPKKKRDVVNKKDVEKIRRQLMANSYFMSDEDIEDVWLTHSRDCGYHWLKPSRGEHLIVIILNYTEVDKSE